MPHYRHIYTLQHSSALLLSQFGGLTIAVNLSKNCECLVVKWPHVENVAQAILLQALLRHIQCIYTKRVDFNIAFKKFKISIFVPLVANSCNTRVFLFQIFSFLLIFLVVEKICNTNSYLKKKIKVIHMTETKFFSSLNCNFLKFWY